MEKTDLTPIRVALLCVTALFLCNTAIAQQTFTVSEKVNVVGNECTKTFTCYYGDNDERIMHGLCKTEGKVKQQEDQYNKYVFSHIENINYSHGKKDGKYLFQQKIYQSHMDVYHDYQINRDKRMRRGWVINTEVTGNYKDDQRDGVWKETIVNRDTLGGEPTKDNKSEKYTYEFSNGKLIELTQPDGTHYTFRYVTKDGSEIPLLSGKYDKYTIKNGIVISHMVRLNGDETEMDNELKQFISNKDNLFDYSDELMEKGYVITEGMVGLSIPYKPYPLCDEFDYKRCTIYKIKKEQITYATIDDIEQYLAEFSEGKFDEELRELMASKYFWSNGKKYINDSVLTELQSAVNKYKEMLAQIQIKRDEIKRFQEKLPRRNKDRFDEIRQSLSYSYRDFLFTTNNTLFQKRIESMQEYLKVGEDYYTYVVKKDKANLITSVSDSIRSIVGEKNPIWQKYSKMLKDNCKYDFDSYCSMKLHVLNKEGFYQYIKDVDEGLIISENCLDYVKAMRQIDMLKEGIAASQYFNYVKAKFEVVIAAANDEWNGKENGDRLRQYITKMEQIKSHIEALGTIDKNNERIVQLTDKAKKIKKIYTNYYTNIQKEYSDNSLEYLNAIINNQNTLIAALEAEEPKEVDKKVKKGDAETMEDIIQIIKHL